MKFTCSRVGLFDALKKGGRRDGIPHYAARGLTLDTHTEAT